MDLSDWEPMWTTKINDYLLVTSLYDDGYSIFSVPNTAGVIIEDEEIYFAVIDHMKAAGVKIVDVDYLKRFMK